MLPYYHQNWEIVEEQNFRRELAIFHKSPQRADNFVESAKWALSRNPRSGTAIGERVWFLPMARGSFVIYYTFDEDKVYLQSIQRSSEIDRSEL
jgi:hypothetical protein